MPSITASSTPVTVTVCATFQLAAVNITLIGRTVPSSVLLLDNPTVTLAVGLEVRTMVKVAVPPASVVCPLIAETVKPATSLSSFITVTSEGFNPL